MFIRIDLSSVKEHCEISVNPSFFVDNTDTSDLFIFFFRSESGWDFFRSESGWDGFIALETSCSLESVGKIVLLLHFEEAF